MRLPNLSSMGHPARWRIPGTSTTAALGGHVSRTRFQLALTAFVVTVVLLAAVAFRLVGSVLAPWIVALASAAAGIGLACVTLLLRRQLRIERELRASKKIYHTLVNGHPDCVKLVAPDGTITMMNPAGVAICGAAAESDIIGHRWQDMVIASDFDAVKELIAAVFAGEERRLEFGLTSAQGRRLRLETTAAPLLNDAGDVELLVSATRDVTSQRELELGYRALFEHSIDPILLADDDRVYTDANNAACKLLGRARGELVGATLEDVFGTDRSLAEAAWRTFLVEGEMRGEWLFMSPAGEEKILEFAAKANILPGRHLSILRDVTDQRRLEGQLRQAQKMDAVGQLASGIAHDFNNLLQAISGHGHLALSHAHASGETGIARDIEQVLFAGERAAELTSQLLTFARQDVDQSEPLDLNDIVLDNERLLNRVMGQQATIVTSLEADLPTIHGDRAQLSQALVNLAINSRDAMPDGGEITITTAIAAPTTREAAIAGLAARPYVKLTVADHGEGMDAATQSRAFEPFFTTKETGKGTGLGLAMVYGVVKQCGGTVTVASDVGIGTTFSIYLPVAEGSMSPAASTGSAEVVGGTETILLVEDDPIVRRVVGAMLENHGYSVVTATGPADATRMGAELNLDLVLTDVMMPGGNGLELGRTFAERRPALHTILMSGHPWDVMTEEDAAQFSFLQKPFDQRELARTVRAALDRPDDDSVQPRVPPNARSL